jgi:hypothetical protein
MLANIDREVVCSPEVQILECKTAGEFGSRLWREGVPEYVQLQVQHQLAVIGKQTADVAVLLCGQQLEIHRIERDDELIARLIVLETKFWECVQHDIQPPADGSESSSRALRQLYPGNDISLDFSQNDVLCQCFSSLTALKTELDEKEQLAEQLKQAIQQAMGDASRAVFAAGEVTYKRSKGGSGYNGIEEGVSIHAPTWGATFWRTSSSLRGNRFNPRAHVGRDPPSPWHTSGRCGKVSIHAPTWGATKDGESTWREVMVSIHAPTWGATISFTEPRELEVRFQSTRPRGARRIDLRQMPTRDSVSIHAPTWGATT